jgi:hypothetical protein
MWQDSTGSLFEFHHCSTLVCDCPQQAAPYHIYSICSHTWLSLVCVGLWHGPYVGPLQLCLSQHVLKPFLATSHTWPGRPGT